MSAILRQTEYPLSDQQEKAVEIMFIELGVSWWNIVDSFEQSGYPITKGQITETLSKTRDWTGRL